jgi:hypothetical protein
LWLVRAGYRPLTTKPTSDSGPREPLGCFAIFGQAKPRTELAHARDLDVTVNPPTGATAALDATLFCLKLPSVGIVETTAQLGVLTKNLCI